MSIKEMENKVIKFMFDNNYINENTYNNWYEEDIVCVDEKVFKLYLALEEMRKLHLAVEKEMEIKKMIEIILVKYERGECK